ncbi:hypothetical protein [Herbaspirillum sp. YR522]|uniref:hypothetical protein n=1 Tax=Herbaspirillum sp. YR522 TaxID=1144342 RepID=UPI0012F84D73|nr:hypothetical protein [Herbaspirillum sp. YR522]
MRLQPFTPNTSAPAEPASTANEAANTSAASASTRPSSQTRHASAIALRPRNGTAQRMQAFLAQQANAPSSQVSRQSEARQTVFDLVKLTNEAPSIYPAELIGIAGNGGVGHAGVELRLDRFLGAFANGTLEGFLAEQHQHGTGAEHQFVSDAATLLDKFKTTGLNSDEQLVLLTWIRQQYGAPAGSYVASHITPLIANWAERASEFDHRDDFAELLSNTLCAVRAETVQRGHATLLQVLRNTITQYELRKAPRSHDEVNEMMRQLEEFPAGHAVSGRRLRFVMECVCEAMQDDAQLLVPNAKAASDAPRDTKRMPNDCAIQWAARLRDMAKSTADPGLKKACEKEYDTILEHFLRHDLSFEFTRAYFSAARSSMHTLGCHSLMRLADDLLRQLPGPEHDDFDRDKSEIVFKTALHDNPYGRVFGTLLCKRIQDAPSDDMRATLSRMSEWLSDYIFPDQHPDEQGRPHIVLSQGDTDLVKALRDELGANELNWRRRMPGALYDFLDSHGDDPDDVEEAVAALVGYLNDVAEEPESIDFIALPHLMFKAMVVDPRDDAPWVEQREQQYAELGTIRQRLVIRDDQPKAIRTLANHLYHEEGSIGSEQLDAMLDTADDLQDMLRQASRRDAVVGITLAHQPPAVQDNWLLPAPRPSNAVIPNFSQHPIRLNDRLEIAPDDPAIPNYFSVMEKNRLRHGEAFGTDLSGVCNYFLHPLAHASKHGAPFDFRAVLNVVAIYLNLDGGHDPSECYGVARLLDGKEEGKLDLGLGLGDNSPDAHFVFDYHMMEDPAQANMQAHFRKAFEQVLDYHDRYSHYAQSDSSSR